MVKNTSRSEPAVEKPVTATRLEQLRAQIKEGTYHVPTERLAEAMAHLLAEEEPELPDQAQAAPAPVK